MTDAQQKQREWYEQWSRYENPHDFLFFDWIAPRTLEDFRDQTVIDAGCGPGHHIELVAPVARHVTGIDLNASEIARARLAGAPNVTFVDADLATYQPEQRADVLYCIGVIHHTDNPDATFENLKRMVRPNGLLIVWCYSYEGNFLVRAVVEPVRRLFLRRVSRSMLERLSWLITALLYPIVYSVYLLPLRGLPFYEYFANFRKLSPRFNMINVFDKLNAPQTDFIRRERVQRWFNDHDFEDVSITPYVGVSWRAEWKTEIVMKVRFEERPAGAATMTPEMMNAVNYYRWTVEQFAPYLGQRILDIGGGYGSHLEMIVRSGREVLSIDLSESSVEFMRERFAAFPNFSSAPLDFGAANDLQALIERRFDTITCMNVLEHIEDDLAALKHMRSILEVEQGRLFLQVPAHGWLYGTLDSQAGHFRRYDPTYLRSVLEGAGFTVERLYFFNSFGVLPWFINARVLRQRLEAESMNLQVRIFDRYCVPILRLVEGHMRLPFGQSLMAVARAKV